MLRGTGGEHVGCMQREITNNFACSVGKNSYQVQFQMSQKQPSEIRVLNPRNSSEMPLHKLFIVRRYEGERY